MVRLTTKLTGAAARRADQRRTEIGKIEGGRCRLRLRPVERLVRRDGPTPAIGFAWRRIPTR